MRVSRAVSLPEGLLHCQQPPRQQKPQVPPLWWSLAVGLLQPAPGSSEAGPPQQTQPGTRQDRAQGRCRSWLCPEHQASCAPCPSAAGLLLESGWATPVLVHSLLSLLFRCLRTCNALRLPISKWVKDTLSYISWPASARRERQAWVLSM